MSTNKETLTQEAALSDSVIYQAFNKNGEMLTTLVSAFKDSTIITKEHIQYQYDTILRTRYSPLVEDVITEFNEGNIILAYSNSIKKVPKLLPFFVTKIGGKIKSIVFVNNYGNLSKSDPAMGKQVLDIQVKDLYVLMESALVAYKYALYPNKILKSLGLMKLSCNIYTQMFLRLLNKDHAISMDQDLNDKVTFCISKFFLENVWGCTNKDIIFSYAKSNAGSYVNNTDYIMLSNQYDDSGIANVEDLIVFIRSLNPRLKEMNFRYFLQQYINTYKDTATFSLECLPYFFYVIEASSLGSFLVNQPIIKDITKNIKNMNTFYPELTRAISI